MVSVNLAELESHLTTYISRAGNGEEIVILDGDLPLARLVPVAAGSDANELSMASEESQSSCHATLDREAFWDLPMPSVPGNAATEALLMDREDSM